MDELKDTGDFLEVPEEDQLEVDDPAFEDPNDDELVTDFSHVPDGEVVTLSTASLDEED